MPNVDFDDPKSRTQRPYSQTLLSPTPALGRKPGKGEAEDSRGWPLGGQSGLRSPGWATRDRGGDPKGWGRGAIGELSLPHPERRGERRRGGVGGSARFYPGLSLRRAPYLLLQSCTLFPPAAALGGPARATTRLATGVLRKLSQVSGLPGRVPGFPAAVCPGQGQGPAACPAQPGIGLGCAAGPTPAVPDAGWGPGRGRATAGAALSETHSEAGEPVRLVAADPRAWNL